MPSAPPSLDPRLTLSWMQKGRLMSIWSALHADPCCPLAAGVSCTQSPPNVDALPVTLNCARPVEPGNSRRRSRIRCTLVQNRKARLKRAFLEYVVSENQRSPFAGPTLAFLSVHSFFSSVRTMERFSLPCSLPFLAFLPFLPFLSFAEQQLLAASALPWQQEEDLPLVHSVLDLLPEQELLWAEAVAPKRKRAPMRKMCFMMVYF